LLYFAAFLTVFSSFLLSFRRAPQLPHPHFSAFIVTLFFILYRQSI